MAKRSGIKYVTVKRSELFDEDIEVYVDAEDLEGKEISAYRVTPDYGEDVVASISAGYTLYPGCY